MLCVCVGWVWWVCWFWSVVVFGCWGGGFLGAGGWVWRFCWLCRCIFVCWRSCVSLVLPVSVILGAVWPRSCSLPWAAFRSASVVWLVWVLVVLAFGPVCFVAGVLGFRVAVFVSWVVVVGCIVVLLGFSGFGYGLLFVCALCRIGCCMGCVFGFVVVVCWWVLLGLVCSWWCLCLLFFCVLGFETFVRCLAFF